MIQIGPLTFYWEVLKISQLAEVCTLQVLVLMLVMANAFACGETSNQYYFKQLLSLKRLALAYLVDYLLMLVDDYSTSRKYKWQKYCFRNFQTSKWRVIQIAKILLSKFSYEWMKGYSLYRMMIESLIWAYTSQKTMYSDKCISL